MKTLLEARRSRLAQSRRSWLETRILGLLAALTIAACGGGSDSAAVGSGGTGSFSVGTITGFGSVFVNGQRYDDSSASVSDEDGPRSRTDDGALRITGHAASERQGKDEHKHSGLDHGKKPRIGVMLPAILSGFTAA